MKGLLKFITCGSVDDGKSTLIGHILYDSKLIYADQKKALELDSKAGSRNGKIDYSLLLDGLMAEREQGITIDVAYRYFTTKNRSFIVADTPGHEEYTRNMAVGASFADLSVILVDASQGVLVQTRRHARICSMMGIKYFVFAVNKMDIVGYSQERFNEISEQIQELRKLTGLENIKIIPLSATEGDNVTVKSENMKWYSGETLLEYLESVDIKSEVSGNKFYMPVQRVSRPDRTFRGFQGQIEAGSISIGDVVRILPSNEKASVKRILTAGKDTEKAYCGQPVTICLDREADVSRGCVLTDNPDISSYRKLSVTLLWTDDDELTVGKDYLIKTGTKLTTGIVTGIDYAVNINTGEHIKAESLSKNSIARCQIQLSEAVTADVFSRNKTLGELILIDRVTNMTSACGIIEQLEGKEEKSSERASFTDGVLKARGDLFEEFYYDVNSYNVFRSQTVKNTYSTGDEIPTKGKSYSYPDNFDILVLRDGVAVIVRERRIKELLKFEDYVYSGEVTAVNGRGFEILARTDEDIKKFIEEYRNSDESTLPDIFSRWLKFDTFRKIFISGSYI